MHVLMELTDMIFASQISAPLQFIHFCELLLMFVSCVYNFVFYLSHGTPNNHSLVCEEFFHGRFMVPAISAKP